MRKWEEIYREASRVLDEYITSRKMRHTIERDLILREVCRKTTSFTAETMLEVLGEQHISRATIYNTLDLLVTCGILSKTDVQLGSGQAKYIRSGLHANKMILVCSECGREEEFKSKEIEDILRGKTYRNFTMEKYSIRVVGHCKRCKKKK